MCVLGRLSTCSLSPATCPWSLWAPLEEPVCRRGRKSQSRSPISRLCTATGCPSMPPALQSLCPVCTGHSNSLWSPLPHLHHQCALFSTRCLRNTALELQGWFSVLNGQGWVGLKSVTQVSGLWLNPWCFFLAFLCAYPQLTAVNPLLPTKRLLATLHTQVPLLSQCTCRLYKCYHLRTALSNLMLELDTSTASIVFDPEPL